MEENKSDFFQLLNSISSDIGIKILELYAEKPEGLNLTDTSNHIGEKTSTVRDHLNRLLSSGLIFRHDKNYHLSNFGSYLLFNLDTLEKFNKTKQIFGKIPAGLIPSEFIYDVAPYITDLEIESGQWKFMVESSRIFKEIKKTINESGNDLRILGWSGLSLSMTILQNYFSEIPHKELIEKTNFVLISDKQMLKDIVGNEFIKNFAQNTDFQDRVYIYEEIAFFQFTLFKYNNIVQMFLNEEELAGGYYFTLENNEKAIEFFNKVFEYYKSKSKCISEFIRSKR